MKRILIAGALLAGAACRPTPVEVAKEPNMKQTTATDLNKPVPLTDEEWRKRLTPDQYHVLREKGTEQPGTGKLLHNTADGTYQCAACGSSLFSSTTKYDACGWPSFWDAVPGTVKIGSPGDPLEAMCAACGSHLGHLFDDGPPPTGKRY